MSRTQVPNVELKSDTARANLLTNGGFEIWQRGSGAFSAIGAFTADRWQIGPEGTDTLSVAREAVNIDVSSGNAAVVTYVHGNGTGGTGLYQALQPNADVWGVRGKPLTLSVRIRTATANVARAFINNNSTLAYSAYHTGDGTYQTLSVTVTVPALPTTLNVGVSFNTSNATVYVDNAMLVVGSVAADYAPLHPADDLARCLRYYEVFNAGSTQGICVGQAYTTTAAQWMLPLKASKAVVPTTTFSAPGTFGVTNVGGGVVVATSIAAFNSFIDRVHGNTAVASGLVAGSASVLLANTGQNATIVVEANP
jgi:hypothetical protein